METEDWGDASTGQETPKTASKHQKLGRGETVFPYSFQRERGRANPLISNFSPSELWENKLLLLQAGLWYFVKIALGNSHTCYPPEGRVTVLWYRPLKGCTTERRPVRGRLGEQPSLWTKHPGVLLGAPLTGARI